MDSMMMDAMTRDMMSTDAMAGVDMQLLQDCMDACSACEQACTVCSVQTMDGQLMSCAPTCMNCADMAGTMMRSLMRMSGMDRESMTTMLEACAAMCRTCMDECMAHADASAVCKMCADACRACMDACAALKDATAAAA